jgi:hypothetical protein
VGSARGQIVVGMDDEKDGTTLVGEQLRVVAAGIVMIEIAGLDPTTGDMDAAGNDVALLIEAGLRRSETRRR